MLDDILYIFVIFLLTQKLLHDRISNFNHRIVVVNDINKLSVFKLTIVTIVHLYTFVLIKPVNEALTSLT
jgi:hypothetical protein